MAKIDPRCFEARAIIRAKVSGVYEDKPRYCVVLRVEHDRLDVAYGQGLSSSDRDLVIKKDSADGRRYKVTKDTYFRPGNIANIPREDVIEYIGIASHDHLLTLQGFAQVANRAAAPVLAAKKNTPPDGKPSDREQAQQQQHAMQRAALSDDGGTGEDRS